MTRSGLSLSALAIALAGCASAPRTASRHELDPAATARGFPPPVQDGYARVRAATQRFQLLDSAVAAGYGREVPTCISHAEHGAMGFHHVNRSLLDTLTEVERPEILLYQRHPDGRYALSGVEYIVPYRVWPPDSVAPRIMGLPMKREDDLRLWYLHMWVWAANPAGLFADWNPAVRCPTP